MLLVSGFLLITVNLRFFDDDLPEAYRPFRR
jgi:hypothetical protein